MGDFNPSAPTLEGGEWAPQSASLITLNSPNQAVVMRVRPGSQTLTAIHVYLANVVGAPGLSVEIVDTLAPNLDASNLFYPTTDTGDTATGWQSQASGAASFAQIGSAARFNPTTYIRNTSALAAGATLPNAWRSTGPSLTSKRIVMLWTGYTAVNSYFGYPNTSAQYVLVSTDLVLSGVRYNGFATYLALYPAFLDWSGWPWPVNPSRAQAAPNSTPDQTWTLFDVNNIINGTDSFGMTVHGRLNAQAFAVASMYVTPVVVPENRHGQNYTFNSPAHVGWNKQALNRVTSNDGHTNSNTTVTAADMGASYIDNGKCITDSLGDIPAGTTVTYVSATQFTLSQPATGTHVNDVFTIWNGTVSGALNANTWYWLVISCPSASPSNYAQIPAVGFLTGLAQPASATATGEHRQYASTNLYGTNGTPYPTGSAPLISGQVTNVAAQPTAPGQALPVLLDASGTILSQSQPYVATGSWEVCASPTNMQTAAAVTNPGQQVTPGVQVAVAGVQLALNWRNLSAAPDQPLVISLRTGVGAITGGGTLVATFTVTPTLHPNGFFGNIPIDGGNAVIANANQQYYVMFTSNATPGQGWVITFFDTRSDLATAGGSTVAAVEGASIGGQVDGLVVNGAQATRYDCGVALVQGPTAPNSLQAQVLAAVT